MAKNQSAEKKRLSQLIFSHRREGYYFMADVPDVWPVRASETGDEFTARLHQHVQDRLEDFIERACDAFSCN